MGYVGNVHLKLITSASQLADMNSIVKVAGSLAINGYDRQVAIVIAMFQLLVRQNGADGLRLLQDLGGKKMADMVLANDDFHVHTEIIFIADNINHLAARTLVGRRQL